MLIIRLQRRGKRNQPFFWIVLTEKTAPPKGKFIEKLGFVNPIKKERNVNKERVKYWLSRGVQVSDTVWNILIEEKIIEEKKRKIKIKPKKKKEKKEGESKGAQETQETKEVKEETSKEPQPEKEGQNNQ